jgi:hypothetical protein
MAISFERIGAPPNRTMPVAALQNFEKTTIYSPDALDIFLTSRFSGSEVRCRDAG